MTSLTASVVGLGRIGTCLAAFLANRGVHIKGVEQDVDRRELIATGNIASNEPGLNTLYARCRDRIELCDIATAAATTDLSFVIVPTPSRPDGTLSDSIVQAVVLDIAVAASRAHRRHMIVVVSTVLPGTLRGPLQEIVRSHSDDLVTLCYSPVFVALGSVLEGLENPPFILIGSDDETSGEKLAAFYAAIGYDPSLLAKTDSVNAEIAKLTLNAFLATKITFANSVAAICQAFSGANAETVLGLIGRDSRVGRGYLRAGTPYGGPCLPRDTEAFVRMAEGRGIVPILAKAVTESNFAWYDHLLQSIVQQAPRAGATFGVFGLTYKPNTDYTDDGFGLALCRDLHQRGFRVIACEPSLSVKHRRVLSWICFLDSIPDVVSQCDVCVLTYPDKELAAEVTALSGSRVAVIDVWRLSASDEKNRSTTMASKAASSIGGRPKV